jgi:hypothetical protein
MTNTELLFAILGTLTPFLVGAMAWMRGLSGKHDTLHDDLYVLREDVAERSARQDTTLEDHDRRITKLEDIVF